LKFRQSFDFSFQKNPAKLKISQIFNDYKNVINTIMEVFQNLVVGVGIKGKENGEWV